MCWANIGTSRPLQSIIYSYLNISVVLVYQGPLNFIIYLNFPILKEVIVYIGYCFISINNNLLVVNCYSSLVVSGFSRNKVNPLNAELNPICHLLALLGAHHILHVSRIKVNSCILFNFCCFTYFCLMLSLTL